MAGPVFTPPDELEGYRVQKLVGRGAMGQVYLARDTLLERAVAIKFLAAFAPGSAQRERFLVEARALARLAHPNVVAVHRAGEWDGHPYLVSEFVRGQSLDRLALPLAREVFLRVATGLAAGLAAAHRRGVLHRDLKPANALLGDDGEVKLCDFGLAKMVDGAGEPAGEARAPAALVPVAAASPPEDLDATPVLPGDSAPPSQLPTPKLGLTRAGALVGTPLYLAPELWRGELATVRSDLYALGAIYFELLTGRPPHVASRFEELRVLATSAAPPALASLAPEVDPGLAELVDRLLMPVAAARPASADEVHAALVALAAPRAAAAPEHPYRGLGAFEAEHRGLFFGRRAETTAIVERLRSEPLVVVAGDSGVGKSSLCRAGVLPAVLEGALGEGRVFRVARAVPGRRPLLELARALADDAPAAPAAPADADALAATLADDPRAVARELSRRLGPAAGLLLFVDQLEELVTESPPAEARAAAEALAALADRVPGVRVLATVRGDFLTRVAALPGLGAEIGRALFVVRPLEGAELREAIVGPARAAGVRFESDALVDELAAAAAAPGALPLLSFALAALWERRDAGARLIPAAALADIGGVAGALARHADGVIAALAPAERAAARRMLAALVTTHGTRAHRAEAELTADDPAARAALAALVRGRLVAVRQADDGGAQYEVAHEALLSGWATLRGWLDQDAGRRAVAERLAAAAAEWERLGRGRAGLWDAPQLAEAARVGVVEGELGGRDRAFLVAARRDRARRVWTRRAAVAALPALAAGVWWWTDAQNLAERRAAAEDRRSAALVDLDAGRRAVAEAAAARAAADAAFARGEAQGGEARFAEAAALAARADGHLETAGRELEAALQHQPDDLAARRLLAEALLARAELAEARHDEAAAAELVARLALYDDGSATAAWFAPATLALASTPPAARVSLARYERAADGRRTLGPPTDLGAAPLTRALPQGAYLLTLTAPDRPPVRLPVLARRGAALRVTVDLPAAWPEGLVYVPAGDFVYGSRDPDELRRTFFLTEPERRAATGAFFIARHEVTWAEWLAFLDALPADAREARRPKADDARVERGADGAWRLHIVPGGEAAFTARTGEPITLPGRDRRREQRWERWPVTGITPEDAEAYAAWLADTGRLPGARLCHEAEWERAARGADGRLYPSGDTLAPDDANIDVTYGRQSLGFGPDEVGSHPASHSPFGVADLAGNAWEYTRAADGRFVIRGGGYFEGQSSARSTNRDAASPGMRDRVVGTRLCADLR